MKKILLSLCALIAFGFSGQAQITFNTAADTAYYNLADDDVSQKAKFTVTSAYSTPVDIEWRVTAFNLPDGLWESAGLCDWVTCIKFEDAADSTVTPIPPNSTQDVFVNMKRKPGASTGCSQVIVEIKEVGGTAQQTIVIVHSSGADKSACIGTVFPTSTKDFSKANLVNVYPNPTNNVVNLDVVSKDVKSVELSNLIGKQISKINISNTGSSVHQMGLQALPRGMYILQFKNAGGKVLGVTRITKN